MVVAARGTMVAPRVWLVEQPMGVGTCSVLVARTYGCVGARACAAPTHVRRLYRGIALVTVVHAVGVVATGVAVSASSLAAVVVPKASHEHCWTS